MYPTYAYIHVRDGVHVGVGGGATTTVDAQRRFCVRPAAPNLFKVNGSKQQSVFLCSGPVRFCGSGGGRHLAGSTRLPLREDNELEQGCEIQILDNQNLSNQIGDKWPT